MAGLRGGCLPIAPWCRLTSLTSERGVAPRLNEVRDDSQPLFILINNVLLFALFSTCLQVMLFYGRSDRY